MTRLTLFRSPELTLTTDRPLIKRDQVSAVDEAVGMLRRIGDLREALDAECEALRTRAQRQGYDQGMAQARRDADQALGRAIGRLDEALAAERALMQARVVSLAMSIVDRIAGDLGPAAMVGAMASRALTELDPVEPVRVRVAPDLVDAVGAHLRSGHPRVQVIAGEALGRFDCEIDTGSGLLETGLPVQLEAIGLALSGAMAQMREVTPDHE
ncbi:MAG: hypothetical protein NTV19_04680 [Burkholderiales bacterium]|nr:hypothetical protein [Burkholderiales bacterium]